MKTSLATTATHEPVPQTRTAQELYWKLLGLVLIAVFPAVFWTLLITLIANLVGYSLSWPTIVFLGTTIALFLGFVYAAIVIGRGTD